MEQVRDRHKRSGTKTFGNIGDAADVGNIQNVYDTSQVNSVRDRIFQSGWFIYRDLSVEESMTKTIEFYVESARPGGVGLLLQGENYPMKSCNEDFVE